MAYIQVRIDDALKSDASLVANNLGIDLPTAVRMFLKQMVRENALPFRPSADPFKSPQNQAYLKKLYDEYKAGKIKAEPHDSIRE